MLKKSFLFFVSLLLFSSSAAVSQTVNQWDPDQWLGTWKGNLQIYSTKNSEVTMQITVSKTSNPAVYQWTILYGEDEKKLERDYELRVKDQAKGLFEIDEKNGILLNLRYLDNSLYTIFSVEKNLLFARYTMKDNIIEYETVSSDMEKTNITGNEESAIVTNYPVFVSQKAALKKQ